METLGITVTVYHWPICDHTSGRTRDRCPPLEATMEYTDRVFEDQSIFLDGNIYRRCKFLECHLTYEGTTGVVIDDCLFRRCTWHFAGPAATTLEFLSAFYHGTAEGSEYNLLDDLVDAIKQGTIGQRPIREPELVGR